MLEPTRVQYYLGRGCSLGSLMVGRAMVLAAAIKLLFSQRRNIKFPPLHQALDTSRVWPKIGFLLHIIAGLSIFYCLNYHTVFP